MKYGDFSMKKADTLFISVVKHPVVRVRFPVLKRPICFLRDHSYEKDFQACFFQFRNELNWP